MSKIACKLTRTIWPQRLTFWDDSDIGGCQIIHVISHCTTPITLLRTEIEIKKFRHARTLQKPRSFLARCSTDKGFFDSVLFDVTLG